MRSKLSIAALVVVALALAGCGGGAKKAAEKTGRTVLGSNYGPLTNSYQNAGKSLPSSRAALHAATMVPKWEGEWPLSNPADAPNHWAAVSDRLTCAAPTSTSNFPDAEIHEVADGRFAHGQATYFEMSAKQPQSGAGAACYGGRSEETALNPWSSSKADHRFYAGHKFTEAWQFAVTPTFLASIKYGSHNGSEITQIHVSGAGKSPWGVSIQPGGPNEESTTEGQLRVNFFGKSESYVGINTSLAIKPNVVYNIVNEYDGESNTTGSWKVYAGPASGGPNPPLVAQESGLRTIREGEPDGATWGWYPGYYHELGAFTGWEAGFNVAPTTAEAKAVAFGASSEPPVETTTTSTTTTTPPPPPAVPAAPTSLTLAVIAGPKVTAAVSPVPGALGYNLYRAGRNYPGHANGTPWASQALPTFTNAYEVESKMWLCYRATAYNAVGESPKSPRDCVDVP